MAQTTHTITEITDDIDGKPVPEGEGATLQFSFEGKAFEIDLNDKNAKKMREAFSFYMDHARPVSSSTAGGRRGATGSAAGRKGRDYDLADLRAWAEREGVDLPSRGRIKASIIEQYQAARA